MRQNPIRRDEEAVVAAARSGDEGAFEQLIVKHRPSLRAHSYRMLGSQDDAEDALQEGLIRAWRGISRFEGRSSVRTWLHRIVTNASLDLIARRRRRTLAAKFRLPADPADWVTDRPRADDARAQPDPDQLLGPEAGRASPEARYEQREAVELAFVAALQHLPDRQRAVLILRDVLSFTAREVAAALDSSPAAVNSALQRARANVAHLNREGGEQATRRSARDGRLDDTAERFVDAFVRDDPEAIIALLAENRSIPETLRALEDQPGGHGWSGIPVGASRGKAAKRRTSSKENKRHEEEDRLEER